MLGRDQIDIVAAADRLQLQVPLGQLLGGQVEAVALVGDVVVLAEDAAQVAAAEEDGAAAVVALQARLLAEVRGDGVHLDRLGADQADAGCFPPVDVAFARAEVAFGEVGVGGGALLGGAALVEEEVARDVVVEEEGRGEVEAAGR